MPRRTGLGEDGSERAEGRAWQCGRQSDIEGAGHDVPPAGSDTVTTQPTASRQRGPDPNGCMFVRDSGPLNLRRGRGHMCTCVLGGSSGGGRQTEGARTPQSVCLAWHCHSSPGFQDGTNHSARRETPGKDMSWKFIEELRLASKYMGKCSSSLEVKDILSFFFCQWNWQHLQCWQRCTPTGTFLTLLVSV